MIGRFENYDTINWSEYLIMFEVPNIVSLHNITDLTLLYLKYGFDLSAVTGRLIIPK